MGTGASRPEALAWEAARTNNARKLRAVLEKFPDLRLRILEFRDEIGRTPLVIAAAKGSVDTANVLLQYGCSVHALAPGKRGGMALHAAAVNGDEMMTDILLQNRANPFMDNQGGITPYELALQHEHATVARKFERLALFHGWLDVETKNWMGKKWTSRWCVVFTRMPCPGSDISGTSSLQMYMFKKFQSTTPKQKLVLDDAHITRGHGNTLKLMIPLPKTDQCQTFILRDASTGLRNLDLFAAACQSISVMGREMEVENRHLSPAEVHPVDNFAGEEGVLHPSREDFYPNEMLSPGPTTSAVSEGDFGEDVVDWQEDAQGDAMEPSAPSAMIGTALEGDGSNAEDVPEEQLCVVCFSRAKEAGFVHGNSLHRCCCLYCASNLMSLGHPCPLCRQPIERVVEVY